MSDRIVRIVIVGGGHAGGRTAEWLRRLGFDGTLSIIGAEPCLPYERPPLSKGLLTGEKSFTDCLLRRESFYRDNDIQLLTGRTVGALDKWKKCVKLADGARIPYDRLVLATGAQPKTLNLPGTELPGVHLLRHEGQAATISEALSPGAHIAVIGGGFIGLEVAAAARTRGSAVTVIEAAGRLLGRSLPAAVAEDIAALHRCRGVEIITGAGISKLTGYTRIEAVELSDGRRVEATAVVIGIGIRPASELAEAAGIASDDGVLTDSTCMTTVPGIYAVGDVARCFNDYYGRRIRLESWQNAEQQAEICARSLLGNERRWRAVPWVWSDQYDWNLQTAGFPADCSDIVRRGDPAEGKALYIGFTDGRMSGAMSFGQGLKAAKDLRLAQMMLEKGSQVEPAAFADEAVSLKTLLKAA